MNDMMKEVVNYHLNRGLDRYEDAVEEAIHGIMIYGLSQGGAFYKLAFR